MQLTLLQVIHFTSVVSDVVWVLNTSIHEDFDGKLAMNRTNRLQTPSVLRGTAEEEQEC